MEGAIYTVEKGIIKGKLVFSEDKVGGCLSELVFDE